MGGAAALQNFANAYRFPNGHDARNRVPPKVLLSPVKINFALAMEGKKEEEREREGEREGRKRVYCRVVPLIKRSKLHEN